MNDTLHDNTIAFELGPIRPPSEAQSILLRLTRNCPWNKCAFCPVYKGEKFSPRTVEEIKQDLDSMAQIRDILIGQIRSLGMDEKDPRSAVNVLKHFVPDRPLGEEYVRQVAYWMYFGMKSLFLQDADSLVMKTDRVVEILEYARKIFPTVERITSYSRAKTISKKTIDELQALRAAGLGRLHLGMESGSDKVLELVCKGVTQDEQIDAGRKAMAAGFELSEYYMPGLGGAQLLKENAVESARVLNAVNPTFIRIRSVIPVPGTPLYELLMEKRWTYPAETEKVQELRMFIEGLEGITSTLTSDHVMNLLEDIEGTLPADKNKMIGKIDLFLGMNDDDRELYITGRRLGRFRGTADFRRDPEISRIRDELKKNFATLDEGILGILQNYI